MAAGDLLASKRVVSGVVLGPIVLIILVADGLLFALFMLAAFGVALYEWAKMAMAGKNPAVDLVVGLVYLPLCFMSFYALREWFESGLFLSLSLILTVWASDSGAYFTGKALGGPKMAPYISPNKTWAGFWGSVASSGMTLFLCFVMAGFLPVALEPGFLDLVIAFVVGCVIGAVGQAGDLSISAFKRRVGVKDTGHLIPGHGGLLDRIDALLLVSLVFAFINLIWPLT